MCGHRLEDDNKLVNNYDTNIDGLSNDPDSSERRVANSTCAAICGIRLDGRFFLCGGWMAVAAAFLFSLRVILGKTNKSLLELFQILDHLLALQRARPPPLEKCVFPVIIIIIIILM